MQRMETLHNMRRHAYKSYMYLIGVLGWFNTRIVLSLIYWVLIPVFGILYVIRSRISAKKSHSMWVDHESPRTNSHELQF